MPTISKISERPDGAAPSTEELEQQIAELKREIAALTKNIAAFGAAKVDDYKSGVEKLASDAVAASMDAFGQARAEAISFERSMEAQVRARPLQAIGIAAGLGFVVALLTRRG